MIDFISIPEKRMAALRRDKRPLKKLTDLIDVKIRLGDDVEIESDDSLLVMHAKNVIKAFGRGFDFEDALMLLDEEHMLDIINITEFSGKSKERLMELRGRVIGTQGKTKSIIEKLTGVKIAVYGKTVSIIGRWDAVQEARPAVCMILEGSKHSGVYKFLEESIRHSAQQKHAIKKDSDEKTVKDEKAGSAEKDTSKKSEEDDAS